MSLARAFDGDWNIVIFRSLLKGHLNSFSVRTWSAFFAPPMQFATRLSNAKYNPIFIWDCYCTTHLAEATIKLAAYYIHLARDGEPQPMLMTLNIVFSSIRHILRIRSRMALRTSTVAMSRVNGRRETMASLKDTTRLSSRTARSAKLIIRPTVKTALMQLWKR